MGEALTYSLVVTNERGISATRVRLTDELPDNLNVRAVSASQGSCIFGGGTLTCDLGTVVGGGTVTVELLVEAASGGTATGSDPEPSICSSPSRSRRAPACTG